MEPFVLGLCRRDEWLREHIGFDGRPLPDETSRRLVPCECFVSRCYPLPPGEPPTVDDLVQEAEAELDPVRRHG